MTRKDQGLPQRYVLIGLFLMPIFLIVIRFPFIGPLLGLIVLLPFGLYVLFDYKW
tara:strand:+ start:1717 stop:1881 length:165 start_codon:yes stop_codon:yes gene_type:complete